MTDKNRLRDLIRQSGLKYSFIANKLGITPYGLQKKINNETEFKGTEIATMCAVLGITKLTIKEAIFFANKSD